MQEVLSIKNIPKVELHRHLDCSWRYSTLVEIAEKQGLINKNDFLKIEKDFLVTQPMNNLTEVLTKFSQAQKILKEPGILKRLTYEVIEDAYNEGIRILELRYSLNFIAEFSGYSYDKIHSEILDGLNAGQKKYPIAVGLISIFQRGQTIANLKKVLDFTLNNKDTFIG
ncbi:MAG: adenosine deaminase, partial [Bdellovibrionales bacterium]|nr:adenosine deaminase [Bdellovibrionales bacterium]